MSWTLSASLCEMKEEDTSENYEHHTKISLTTFQQVEQIQIELKVMSFLAMPGKCQIDNRQNLTDHHINQKM